MNQKKNDSLKMKKVDIKRNSGMKYNADFVWQKSYIIYVVFDQNYVMYDCNLYISTTFYS